MTNWLTRITATHLTNVIAELFDTELIVRVNVVDAANAAKLPKSNILYGSIGDQVSKKHEEAKTSGNCDFR